MLAGAGNLSLGLTGTVLCFVGLAFILVLRPYFHNASLRHIPGPRLYALSRFRLAYDAWHGRSVHNIHEMHQKYGPAIRVGPDQVSFNSLSALRTIYGAGSAFERTSFYKMFDVYGKPNLFTFTSGKDHRDRKKLLSHIYANQTVLGAGSSELVMDEVLKFMQLLEREPETAGELFTTLHYFSIDSISNFVYGPEHGGTRALSGSRACRALLDDILNPARRRLSWFAVHFPKYTRWITSRTGLQEKLVTTLRLLPCSKPFVYTGIRNHALSAFFQAKTALAASKEDLLQETVIGRLLRCQEKYLLTDMDIASECADHLLAGIDTTADALMFVIWALSLPQNQNVQQKLSDEVLQIPAGASDVLHPRDLTQLPYLNAVLKESLRLYSPLPTYEPRSCPSDSVIDGYTIPAGTIVGMSPYCLHREPSVFPEPLHFRPERWLTTTGTLISESDPQNRLFWAFSSGARMCIGMHLANAEMLTLVAAVYRRYRTVAVHPDTTPGITSRYELFHDETMKNMAEHECWINFKKLD